MNRMNKLVQKIKKNEFINSVIVLMSGSALSQIIVVLITPILTRLYGPEAFGMFSVYLSILFTIGTFVSLRYEVAIPLPKKEIEAINLLVLSCLILILFIGIVVIIISIFHYHIAHLFQAPNLANYLGYLSISLLGLGFFEIFLFWSLRKEKYTRISRGKVQMNLFHAGGQLSLGFISGSPTSLIIGEVIGRNAGGIGLGVLSWKEMKNNFHLISWNMMKQMAIRYRRFPLITTWSSLLGALTNHLPTFFIVGTLGVKAAGWYLIANRVLALPNALLGYSVEQVYLAKSAKLLHRSYSTFVQLFWETVKKLTVISFILFTLAAILAPKTFSLIFGELWYEAGVFVQCMSILFFVQLIAGPISINFDLLELQHLDIFCGLIRFLLLIGSMLYSNLFLVEDWQVVLCLSIAGAIGFMIVGIFSWYALQIYREKGDIHG